MLSRLSFASRGSYVLRALSLLGSACTRVLASNSMQLFEAALAPFEAAVCPARDVLTLRLCASCSELIFLGVFFLVILCLEVLSGDLHIAA